MTSLKAVIAGESLISVGLDIDRILQFVFFMIKYFKFPDNNGSRYFPDTYCQNTDKFKKSGDGGGGGEVGGGACNSHSTRL